MKLGGNVDMVCAHISKYGNNDNRKVKIAVKYARNQKKMKDEVGGLMCTWSVRTLVGVGQLFAWHV
jgi:3-oxoacyl-[acyl-carrier-protein] synthase III